VYNICNLRNQNKTKKNLIKGQKNNQKITQKEWKVIIMIKYIFLPITSKTTFAFLDSLNN